MLEALLHASFERAIGGDGVDSYILLGRTQSVSARFHIIQDTLRYRCSGQIWAETILDASAGVQAAISYRNRLAHGLYVSNGPDMEIFDGAISNTRKTVRHKLTKSGVREEYKTLETLIEKIDRAVNLPHP